MMEFAGTVSAIAPYRIAVPDREIEDLRRRQPETFGRSGSDTVIVAP
jgi:hypothetical protein